MVSAELLSLCAEAKIWLVAGRTVSAGSDLVIQKGGHQSLASL
jgi:hypothetical protein